MSPDPDRTIFQAARIYPRSAPMSRIWRGRNQSWQAQVRPACLSRWFTARRRQMHDPTDPSCCGWSRNFSPAEVVAAEKIDRISRLPLPETELLVATVSGKGAGLAAPGIVDLFDLVADSFGVVRIVPEIVQDTLLRITLQTGRDDHEARRKRRRAETKIAKRAGRCTGCKPDLAHHPRIIGTREAAMSIACTGSIQHRPGQASDRPSPCQHGQPMHQVNGAHLMIRHAGVWRLYRADPQFPNVHGVGLRLP